MSVFVKIKGTSLVARREIITRQFGADAWTRLVDDMARAYPYFRSPLVAASLVPVREFLAFHDELVRRFFNGDPNVYFRLGEESARWALTKGPYAKFLRRKDVAAFVDSIPSLSSAYWEQGTTSYFARLDGRVVELEVTGLPEWHPYFEYLVVGYIRTALEMLCGSPVQSEALKGGSGSEYRYRFTMPQ
ncbi:MAG TPA: hypothetical protein VE987_04790 [Polyangiaceae bacterium]|nr:hypothetical protein [Polyangiaceae bacterium]